MIAVVILLILVVLALAVWGATMAATGLTLAVTNAVLQTTVAVLACVLVAGLPLAFFAVWRLSALRAELDAARIIAIAGRSPVGDPALGAGQPTLLLPAPREVTNAQSPMLVSASPRGTAKRSGTHRASRRVRQAGRIAQRWFR